MLIFNMKHKSKRESCKIWIDKVLYHFNINDYKSQTTYSKLITLVQWRYFDENLRCKKLFIYFILKYIVFLKFKPVHFAECFSVFPLRLSKVPVIECFPLKLFQRLNFSLSTVSRKVRVTPEYRLIYNFYYDCYKCLSNKRKFQHAVARFLTFSLKNKSYNTP